MNIINIATVRIKEPSNEMRRVMTHEGLEELRESIRRNGLLQPITVTKIGEFWEVVAGARRFFACKSLMWDSIPCMVIDGKEKNLEEIKIHENLKREDVDPVDEGFFYSRLVSEKDWTLDDLMKATGRGAHYIDSRIEITYWDKGIQDAVTAKAINLSVAKELMKFKVMSDRHRYLIAAAGNGVTARTMESWRLQHEASNVPVNISNAEGSDSVPVTTPKIRQPDCMGCGVNLDGMMIHYLTFCDPCKVQMERAAREQSANPPTKQ